MQVEATLNEMNHYIFAINNLLDLNQLLGVHPKYLHFDLGYSNIHQDGFLHNLPITWISHYKLVDIVML